MLELEDIIQKLAPVQLPIAPKNVKYDTHEIPTSLASLFGEQEVNRFYYMVVPCNKKSILYSLLHIIDPQFKMLSSTDAKKYVTLVRQTMSADIDAKKLFKRYNYQKDRTMKKSVLQRTLLVADSNLDTNDCFKKFMVDYFSINLFVFELDQDYSFLKMTHILSTDDTLESTPYKPTIFMLKIVDIINVSYLPILTIDNVQWFFYPDSDILERIFHQYSDILDNDINVNKKSIELAGRAVHLKITKKLTRSQLQSMAKDNGINIKKRSKQTKNMIYKNKEELIADLMVISSSSKG